MDHFIATAEAEDRADLGRAPADDARGVGIGIGHQAARDLGATLIDDAHRVAALEASGDRADTRRL